MQNDFIKFNKTAGIPSADIPDNVCGLVLQIYPDTSAAQELIERKVFCFHNMAEAEEAGVSIDMEGDRISLAYLEIKDFFEACGGSGELWVGFSSHDMNISDLFSCDINTIGGQLIFKSDGRISLLGIGGYCDIIEFNPPKAQPIDLLNNIEFLDSILWEFAISYPCMPMRIVLPVRPMYTYYNGNNYSFDSIKENIYGSGRVMASLVSRKLPETTQHYDLMESCGRTGLILGMAAAVPVHRSIARIMNGNIPGDDAIFAFGALPEDMSSSYYKEMDEKDYVFPIIRAGKAGYFLSSERLIAQDDNFCNTLCSGRVMDKIQRIVYATCVPYINNHHKLTAEGRISSEVLKEIETSINEAVSRRMISAGEVSQFECYIDPECYSEENGMKIDLRALPTGHHKNLSINMKIPLGKQ